MTIHPPERAATTAADVERLRFQLLGPIRVSVNSQEVVLNSVMVRAVLAVLMIAEGRYVAQSSIVRALWDNPPKSAESNIRSYVTQLRAALRAAHPALPQRLVARRGTGEYRLLLQPGELDVTQFNEASRHGQAQMLRDDSPAAADSLRVALSHWYGGAGQDIANVITGRLHHQLEFLDERRLTVTEDYIDACIAAGAATALVQQVRTMVLEHPLRERSWEQLVRTLYLSGDPAGALDAFHLARHQLSDRLGIEPSRRLQGLQRAVLQRDDIHVLDGYRHGPIPRIRIGRGVTAEAAS
jgi:DNA-binding SARP family transcriptional activator